ncbi:FAD-dependent monooxygenase [Streptomyces sp. URMC 126]|uniref:FAD-dependent monooxygenase n=1 Tax=Streptomyces sp. URMC 126 TaxID=3423401 RepID=UPI003F1D9181
MAAEKRPTDTAVLIAGAGPAGLVLAGELRLAGVDCVLVDRLPEPSGESRGLGFNARTMEIFDQRGILPLFGDLTTTRAGHFGGLPLDFGVLDGGHFGVQGIPQSRTEEVLTTWVSGLGADIRRGWELVGLTDDGAGVDVLLRTPDGERRLRASYVVGCDGGRSTVRRLAGFAFPGTAATLELLLADVTGVDIRPRPDGPSVPGGMAMWAPLGGGVVRVIMCERAASPRRRTEPPGFDEVAATWQRLTGEDIGDATPRWVSSFGDATRQAAEYRRGRVLLAGDAAHIHLPAGGQGLNVSVQDAVNLGWKLAAEVQGRAPEGLLDTYHSERHPVGARLLLNTRAQGLLMLGGDAVRPLRDVLGELLRYEAVGRHLAGMVSGLDVRYAAGPDDHPLVGRRMPDTELVTAEGPCRTAELLRAARGVLLDLSDDAGLRAAAAGWADRVDVVTAKAGPSGPRDSSAPSPSSGSSRPESPDAPDAPDDPLAGAAAVLLRPDGHVAWAAPGPGADGLPEALRRWFGAPRPPAGDH